MLAKLRKSKFNALIGAFQTVISKKYIGAFHLNHFCLLHQPHRSIYDVRNCSLQLVRILKNI